MELEFLQDYLVESRELLQKAQEEILRLEADPGNDDALASIFRAFHTIKGGAGFLDATHLVNWAHGLENLLDKLRSHLLPVTSARIDAILGGIDVLSAMFQDLGREEEPGPGPADLGRTINMLAGTEPECAGPPAGAAPVADAQVAPLDEAAAVARPLSILSEQFMAAAEVAAPPPAAPPRSGSEER